MYSLRLFATLLKFYWQTSAAYTSQIFLGYFGVGCELMVQQHPSLSSCGIRRLCSHGGEQLDLISYVLWPFYPYLGCPHYRGVVRTCLCCGWFRGLPRHPLVDSAWRQQRHRKLAPRARAAKAGIYPRRRVRFPSLFPFFKLVYLLIPFCNRPLSEPAPPSSAPPSIGLEGVTFTYPGQSLPVLKEVSLEIPSGFLFPLAFLPRPQ